MSKKDKRIKHMEATIDRLCETEIEKERLEEAIFECIEILFAALDLKFMKLDELP